MEDTFMPVDNEQIKGALDKFEADDYISAKEIIRNQVVDARDAYLKDKLGLKGPKEEKKPRGRSKKE
jgi:hypothetical protein